ncbi:polysaccharide pyruvyl transferase family protein [Oceanisphaera psychrotolerans]|uniref:Polysaccharide pyruvyl transferase n=1 Tax=Oceanisphaera psychrotolerans TaxID=1414654 RepID=A0A1J4QEA4_9GAMM|nr:polysaccharide pyruvyl transferase family protein [Oceanisphaera psychrotolerans]OIN07238.1 polysaccharide pyruvyl transferase [Oceanisphaera psychrotolerans]
MKIAIMTQPLGKNYGGIMQAWALQHVLKRMGHEVVTINRQPNQPSIAHKAARLAYRAGMKAIGKRKAPINFEKRLPYILQNTQSFIDQHITMSEPLYSTQQLREHFDRENYDAVIVGSDQVWRPKYSPCIENFFLDFLEDKKIKRIAYAASFGVDEWEFTEEQTQRCAALAKQFDAISVREDSGVELCRKHLGVEATHVLDPTLLLDKADYEQLIGAERLNEKPSGVYTYFLDKTPEKFALAQQVSQELGESIYSCRARKSIGEDASEITDYIMPNIKDWLAGFANAKFVLTDSFHGMVFSILFQKPFRVINNTGRGTARFISLLELTQQTDCFITIEKAKLNAVISVCEKILNIMLDDMRKKSDFYLGAFLND